MSCFPFIAAITGYGIISISPTTHSSCCMIQCNARLYPRCINPIQSSSNKDPGLHIARKDRFKC